MRKASEKWLYDGKMEPYRLSKNEVEVNIMSQYSLRLPEDLNNRATELAKHQGASLNLFFLYAISSTVSGNEARELFENVSVDETKRKWRNNFIHFWIKYPPGLSSMLPIRLKKRVLKLPGRVIRRLDEVSDLKNRYRPESYVWVSIIVLLECHAASSATGITNPKQKRSSQLRMPFRLIQGLQSQGWAGQFQ